MPLIPCGAQTEDRMTGQKREAVEAYRTGVPGLVATCIDARIARAWRLTHQASGQAIGGGPWSGTAHFSSAEEADVAACKHLAGVDWTRDASAIRTDDRAADAVHAMVNRIADERAHEIERERLATENAKRSDGMRNDA